MTQQHSWDNFIAAISATFRVREDRRPTYIDLAANLSAIDAAQHQIIFGRRGTGKSCLLLHHHFNCLDARDRHSCYISADTVKRLSYPDLLIRLLLHVLESLPQPRRRSADEKVASAISSLRELLAAGDAANIREEHSRRSSGSFSGGVSAKLVTLGGERSGEKSSERISEYKEEKLAILERNLNDYTATIAAAIEDAKCARAYVIIDDFYLINGEVQPDVIDYLHRLLRPTIAYLKIGTVRQRTQLARRHPQFVGVELYQDVEEIDLDYTLDDLPRTRILLERIAQELANDAGIRSPLSSILGDDVAVLLTLSSGGVPRDYLNVLMAALRRAIERGDPQVNSSDVTMAGAEYWRKVKYLGLDDDLSPEGSLQLRALFEDVFRLCVDEIHSNVFLVSRPDAQASPVEYECLLQLMDAKLIHLIRWRTAVPSKGVDYSAFMLDTSSYRAMGKDVDSLEIWHGDVLDIHDLSVSERLVYPLKRAEFAISSALQVSEPKQDDLLSGASLESAVKYDHAIVTALPIAISSLRRGQRVEPPRVRRARTVTFSVAGAAGLLTVGEYEDGSPCDFLLKLGKQGSTLAGFTDAFSSMVSLAIQCGVGLFDIVAMFMNTRFEPAGITDDADIRMASSVMDYAMRRIGLDYLSYEARQELGLLTTEERSVLLGGRKLELENFDAP